MTGCEDPDEPNPNGGVAVSKVYIKDTDKPQLTFVQGNEPDFSAGKLSVERENGSLETIALNAEGVSLTGYDKSKLGEQTVTFTYEGKATTLKVNVVRRMVFKGIIAKYFLGDTFDKSAGTVRITTDNGKTVNLTMSDESIAVEGFDSATAGTQNVTVRYTANGVNYTDTVSVTVYEVGTVKFSAPGKLTYKSHDTELKINDGYFTVTAKDDSTMTKLVPLTQEMIVPNFGFDPSKATKENVTTPLPQEIKVAYSGQEFSFSISIVYSGVSIMLDAIEELKDLKWETSVPTYTEEQGELAMEAVGLYFDLSTSDRALIDEEQAKQVIRLAAVYGTKVYLEILDEFSDAFVVDVENGAISFVGKSYEAVNAAATRFADPADPVIVTGEFLNDILAGYGAAILYDTVKIENAVFVMNDNVVTLLKEIFSHMAKLHNDLKNIPAEWTKESLENYAGEIATAVRHMDAPNFGRVVNYVFLCDMVSSWRENDDYLEIIYTYYMTYKDADSFAADLWQRQVPLPGNIQTLYSMIASGLAMIKEYTGGAVIWKDTTSFLLLYDQAIELSNKIAAGEDGLEKQIFYFVNFPLIISENLSGAYRTFCNSLYGDPEFGNMYGVYLTIIRQIAQDGEEYDIEKYLKERQDLIEIFTSLSPAKQKAFLGCINYLYHAEPVYDYMLMDISDGGSRTVMMQLIAEYLLNQGLSLDFIKTTVNDFFLAIEYYINTDRYEGALKGFMEKMDAVMKAYNGNTMTEEEKKLFEKLLGNAYNRYVSIYEFEKRKAAEESIVLGDAAALLDELKATYAQIQGVLDLLANKEADRQDKDRAMVLLFAAYEKCARLAAEIVDTTDYNVLGTFYNTVYQITENVKGTMDDALVYYRGYYISYLLSASYGTMDQNGNVTLQPTWNLYASSENIGNFMAAVSDMLNAIINGGDVTDAMIAKAKEAMQVLTENELALFRVLAGAENYVAFMSHVLSDDMDPMLTKLDAIVKAHLAYAFAEEADQKATGDAFKAAMQDAAATVESLEENEEFQTYLEPMYDQFLTIVNAMNQPEQAPEQTPEA